jgi:protein TonB
MSAWAADDCFDASPTIGRRAFLGIVVVAHAALLALFGMQAAPVSIERPVKALDVAIVDEPTPPRPPEPPPLPVPKAPVAPHAPTVPPPEIVVAAPPPPITVAVAPPAPVPPAPSVEVAAPAVAAPAAPPAPPASPPAPKHVPPDALDWLIKPPDDFPPMSKRLQETGKVLLRVVFDVGGYPRSVSLHRSSGFTRLDEQAVTSMRKARIHPCKENGVAIECQLIATMVYELED